MVTHTSSQLSASIARILPVFDAEQIQIHKTSQGKQKVIEEDTEWTSTESSSELMDASTGLQQARQMVFVISASLNTTR